MIHIEFLWPLFIMAVVIMAMRSKHERRMYSLRMRHQQADRETPAQSLSSIERRELEDLRERVRVLERIATEGNSLDAREARRISEEIEALRDKQAS